MSTKIVTSSSMYLNLDDSFFPIHLLLYLEVVDRQKLLRSWCHSNKYMQLRLEHARLTIDLEWYEQLWAVTLDRQMHIPLDRIDRVTTAEPQSDWATIRAPGTFLPGVIKAGTYYTKKGKEFWYVTSDRNYLTVELHDAPYWRLVMTIPDNIGWEERIDRALNEFKISN